MYCSSLRVVCGVAWLPTLPPAERDLPCSALPRLQHCSLQASVVPQSQSTSQSVVWIANAMRMDQPAVISYGRGFAKRHATARGLHHGPTIIQIGWWCVPSSRPCLFCLVFANIIVNNVTTAPTTTSSTNNLCVHSTPFYCLNMFHKYIFATKYLCSSCCRNASSMFQFPDSSYFHHVLYSGTNHEIVA
jgi:hypothetical protein